MKIYLDNCCLNRPYDDLNNEIVRLEAEAVLSIIDKCENSDWVLYNSDILLDEIENTPDRVRKQKLLMLYRSAEQHINLTADIVSRAKEIERVGIKPYDALHIASAENSGVDMFLTTDHKLVSLAKKLDTTIQVKNPLVWLTEVLYN